jgi:hypothetical protein
MPNFWIGELVWIRGDLKFANYIGEDEIKALQNALPSAIGDNTPNRCIMIDGMSVTVEYRAPYTPSLVKEFCSKLGCVSGVSTPENVHFRRI